MTRRKLQPTRSLEINDASLRRVIAELRNLGVNEEGRDLVDGEILSSSGFSVHFLSPTYRSPSQEWIDYLKQRNLNIGLEDTANAG